MKIKMPVIFKKAETMSDMGLKMVFETRELGEDSAHVFSIVHKEAWLVISPNDDITEADIPDEKADSMTGQKTKAQRLRAVIYKLWEQAGSMGSFETYYQAKMEDIIDHLKERLE